mmetsp:Transcript_36238/g.104224  ORF Transcript_36238/g.104224 Transcript_36238/m.104224 type:complete len:249 (+) Transcript_36238:491-1237(+)
MRRGIPTVIVAHLGGKGRDCAQEHCWRNMMQQPHRAVRGQLRHDLPEKPVQREPFQARALRGIRHAQLVNASRNQQREAAQLEHRQKVVASPSILEKDLRDGLRQQEHVPRLPVVRRIAGRRVPSQDVEIDAQDEVDVRDDKQDSNGRSEPPCRVPQVLHLGKTAIFGNVDCSKDVRPLVARIGVPNFPVPLGVVHGRAFPADDVGAGLQITIQIVGVGVVRPVVRLIFGLQALDTAIGGTAASVGSE